MPMEIPLWRRLWIGALGVLAFLLAVVGVLALALLLALPGWVLAAIVVAAAVLASPFFLLRRAFARGRPGWSPALSFLVIAAVVFVLGGAALTLPVYYLAYLVDARPTLMPLVTLTDGKKTVQFQGMQHVGSEAFYKGVV